MEIDEFFAGVVAVVAFWATEAHWAVVGALICLLPQNGETARKRRFRHRKTGGLYVVIGHAKLQICDKTHDMTSLVLYRGVLDGKVWARPETEFLERFEVVQEREREAKS